MTNVISYGNSPHEIADLEGTFDITFSDIQGNGGGSNIDVLPQFVGNGDYHLTASSPCLNVGTLIGAPDLDIDGNLRPQGSGIDIGADEFIDPAVIAPTAGFSANILAGILSLEVQFTDPSSGTITSWAWDFGDGTTSALQNPGHTYQSPGEYSVSLTVTGPGGIDTLTRQNYIVVAENEPPTAFGQTIEAREGVIYSGILTAYDRFNDLDILKYDWRLLDDIWTGRGYRWDQDEQRYIILP